MGVTGLGQENVTPNNSNSLQQPTENQKDFDVKYDAVLADLSNKAGLSKVQAIKQMINTLSPDERRELISLLKTEPQGKPSDSK